MNLNRRTAVLLGTASLAIAATGVSFARATPAAVSGVANYVLTTLAVGERSRRVSQLALERAINDNVRTFAALEISEQDTVASILKAAAAESDPPVEPLGEDEVFARLSALPPGQEFDLAYVEAQISGHNDLLAAQKTASGGIELSVEGITARLVEQAVTSHIAMLGFIQQLLGAEHAANVERSQDAEDKDITGQ